MGKIASINSMNSSKLIFIDGHLHLAHTSSLMCGLANMKSNFCLLTCWTFDDMIMFN